MTAAKWAIEPGKFLTQHQASRLLVTTREWANACGTKTAIRDYFAMDLMLNTGLRVMELAALTCSDLSIENRLCSVRVRSGKGGRMRIVYFIGPLRDHCRDYLNWKHQIGESVDADAPLLRSSNTGGHLSTRALQKMFKRCSRRAGLSPRCTIHCLRHTYACLLLKASGWNLRLVQKQLGHAQLSTTQIYADVMMPDIEKALRRLHI